MDKLEPVRSSRKRNILVSTVVIFIAIVALSIYFILNRQQSSINRPQEPRGPFSYSSENVSFQNEGANITLTGTLTIPSKGESNHRYPAVILISGYGPQNRDAEWYGHKPFLIIADHLTSRGIAVLRFDDRSFGKSSKEYHSSTSLDFSTDVESAFNFLKTREEVDTMQIGLIGHSDGAMIAPMVAARRTDVGFIVLLAGPGIPGSELMIKRQELWERKAAKSESEIRKSIGQLNGVISIVVNSKNQTTLEADLTNFANDTKDQIPDDQVPHGMSKDEFISQQVELLSSPWFKFFFTYDPKIDLKRVRCPVLALTGDKDVQAPASENLRAIQSALSSGGNEDVTVKEIKDLNHMFQECNTGMMDEYAKIDQTFSTAALDEISKFVLEKSN